MNSITDELRLQFERRAAAGEEPHGVQRGVEFRMPILTPEEGTAHLRRRHRDGRCSGCGDGARIPLVLRPLRHRAAGPTTVGQPSPLPRRPQLLGIPQRATPYRGTAMTPKPTPIKQGDVFRVPYPFQKSEWIDEDREGIQNFKPGVLKSNESQSEYGEEWTFSADGIGEMILTVVDVYTPPMPYRERIVYTVGWVDPSGNRFGKPSLQWCSVAGFRGRLRYRHPFEIDECHGTIEEHLARAKEAASTPAQEEAKP